MQVPAVVAPRWWDRRISVSARGADASDGGEGWPGRQTFTPRQFIADEISESRFCHLCDRMSLPCVQMRMLVAVQLTLQ